MKVVVGIFIRTASATCLQFLIDCTLVIFVLLKFDPIAFAWCDVVVVVRGCHTDRCSYVYVQSVAAVQCSP